MNRGILIVSYTFPPYPGIGGRRWSKFAKYLKRNGHKVHIISCENPFPSVSEWSSDVEGIPIHCLPLRYPLALLNPTGSIMEKVMYRLSLWTLQLLSSSNYYDKTIFWGSQVKKAIKKISSEHNLKNIIVTGAPFHIMHHVSELKSSGSDFNLITDFRDFWTDDRSLSSMATISKRRFSREMQMEKEVLERSDKVFTVSDFMTDTFNKKYKIQKCYTLPNGFDAEDYNSIPVKPENSDKIKFIFTGNLYNKIENIFVPFCEAIRKIKETDPNMYQRLEFEFYGWSSNACKELVKKLELNVISFKESISLPVALQKVSESDYTMLFLNNTYSFSLSTKFCEYVGLNKSIVLFSEQGTASDYISSSGLGIWIEPKHTFEKLYQMISKHDPNKEVHVNEEIRKRHSIQNIFQTIETKLV